MELKAVELRLRRWAYFLLIYTILVILWGAWVRISHSGDGCGDTWPLCNGKLVPEAARGKTWVEYGHRFTSGLYGIVVMGLFFYVRQLKNKFKGMDSTYRWMTWTLVFMFSEAALGAKLVLFGLVNTDQSVWRLAVMSLHQLNSFMLVAFTVRFLAATYESHYQQNFGGEPPKLTPVFFAKPAFLICFLVIAVTGAWASLSTTLFPSTSLMDGLMRDMESGSHIVLRIRGTHPIFAVLIGGSLSFGLYKISSQLNAFLSRIALAGSALIALGIVVGIVTLFLLSPVPLKLIHLLLAHTLWSTSVFFFHFYSLAKGKGA